MLDFSEWATYLSDVRMGSLRGMPDLLRLSVALAAAALSASASQCKSRALRWIMRGIALLPVALLLPPYAGGLSFQAFRPWFSESYRLQLAAASVGFAGVLLAAGFDAVKGPNRPSMILTTTGVLACLSLAAGAVALAALIKPFSAHYNHALFPGWGAVSFFCGILSGAVLQGAELMQRLREAAAVKRAQKANGSA
jgi:hypothetical protein